MKLPRIPRNQDELLALLRQGMRNPYALTAAGFLIWVIFIDHSRLVSQYSLQLDLWELQEQKEELLVKIDEVGEEKKVLDRDREKYGRERYYLKHPNEDIYIVE